MSDGGVPYLELVLSVSVAITLLHLYLDVRQRKVGARNVQIDLMKHLDRSPAPDAAFCLPSAPR
jgi:hypothetical protein